MRPVAPAPLADITLAVLAGGEGARMGRPKGTLHIEGRPVLEYLLDAWAWPGPTLLVTAPGREDPPGWRRFDRQGVDPVAGQGPLRGALTALEHTQTHLLVIAAVDMPAVRAEHLQWAAGVLIAEPALTGVMATRPTDDGPQVEPLPCALRVEPARRVVAEALAAGMRSLHGLTRRPAIVARPAPSVWPPSVWTNLNRPAELRAWQDSAAATARQTMSNETSPG